MAQTGSLCYKEAHLFIGFTIGLDGILTYLINVELIEMDTSEVIGGEIFKNYSLEAAGWVAYLRTLSASVNRR